MLVEFLPNVVTEPIPALIKSGAESNPLQAASEPSPNKRAAAPLPVKVLKAGLDETEVLVPVATLIVSSAAPPML